MTAPRIAEMTTLRLGGPAHSTTTATTTEAVVAALDTCDDAGTAVLVIGGGSNLVVADEGFNGTVIAITSGGIEFGTDDGRPFTTADAGVEWDALVARTVDEGYGGLECLSGIPGSTGATPVQNVGAYGVEIADVLRAVQVYDRGARRLDWVSPGDLDLRYRHSNLKHRDNRIVTAVSLWLRPNGVSAPLAYRELARALGRDEGQSADAAAVRDAVLELRRSKGMVLDAGDPDTYSAGSFFTNPIVSAAESAAVLAQIAVVVGPDTVIPQFPSGTSVKTYIPLESVVAVRIRVGASRRWATTVTPGSGARAAGRASCRVRWSAACSTWEACSGWRSPIRRRALSLARGQGRQSPPGGDCWRPKRRRLAE